MYLDDDDTVAIGSVVFALIDPTPGREIAFNRWYERDHYYTAGIAAPGVFAAGRYVAPRSCKDLRRSGDDGVAGDAGRGSHLALYFVLDGHEVDRIGWATRQVAIAAEDDRLFSDREHLHTWSYRPAFSWIGVDGVAPGLTLDRRYSGASVVFADRSDDVDAATLEASVQAACEQAAGVAVVLALTPLAQVMPSEWIGDLDPARRSVFVCFHDGPVADGWRAARSILDAPERDGLLRVAWASPFVATAIGTDIHADDL